MRRAGPPGGGADSPGTGPAPSQPLAALSDWTVQSLPADAVEVARWAGAWGVRGEFRVQPYSADAAALLQTRDWLLVPAHDRLPPRQCWTLTLRRAPRWHGGVLLGASTALTDRDLAQALQGSAIWLPRSAFPVAADDEYYWVDLIGLSVINRDGLCLGVVRDLLATGAQTVLVLDDTSNAHAQQRMIPFVNAYIDRVDLAAGRVLVDWSPDFD